jgi:hypothetical protein
MAGQARRPGGAGDIVAVVETQKGAIEIEIFEAGEVELLAEPGQTLPVGAPLARLGAAADDAPAPPPGRRERRSPERQPHPPEPAPKPSRTGRAAIAPPPCCRRAGRAGLARRAARAAELGIALAVAGSGPGGAVLLSDVERTAAPAGAAPPRKEPPKGKPGLDMAEMRRAIAAAMSRSKREIPHYYLGHEIDLQTAQDWLTAHNADRTPDRRLLMGALLIRATVRALAKVPELNGRFEAEPFAPGRRPLRAGGGDARRRADRPRDPDAQDMDLTRSWRDARHGRPHPHRPAAQQRDHPRHDHRLEPGRGRGGCAARRDLPAAGGAGRLWRAAPAPHGARRAASCRALP